MSIAQDIQKAQDQCIKILSCSDRSHPAVSGLDALRDHEPVVRAEGAYGAARRSRGARECEKRAPPLLHPHGLRGRRRHAAQAVRVLHGERTPARTPDLHLAQVSRVLRPLF